MVILQVTTVTEQEEEEVPKEPFAWVKSFTQSAICNNVCVYVCVCVSQVENKEEEVKEKEEKEEKKAKKEG